VEIISALRTTSAVTSNWCMLRRNTNCLFLRNVGYYKSHTASHPWRWHLSFLVMLCPFVHRFSLFVMPALRTGRSTALTPATAILFHL
jgi:hypothetical protein